MLTLGLAALGWWTADGMAARYLTDTRRAAGRDGWRAEVPADGPTPGTIFFGRARPSEEPPGLRLVRVSDEVRHTGLVPGDVILTVDGQIYGNTREISRGLIRERLAGEQVTVRVWKQEGRREEELELTLDPFLRHPGDLGLEYEEIEIPSESGFTLRGWYVPPPADSDGRSGVFVHGARSSRFQGLRMAEHWHAREYGMLIVDLSGRGSSGGDHITYTVNERHDVAAMTRWLRERGVPAHKLAVFGTSNGAASAIYAAVMDPEIAALALDAPYSDLWTISREDPGGPRAPDDSRLAPVLGRRAPCGFRRAGRAAHRRDPRDPRSGPVHPRRRGHGGPAAPLGEHARRPPRRGSAFRTLGPARRRARL